MKDYKIISYQLAVTYGNRILSVGLNLLLFMVLTRYLSKSEYGMVSLFFTTIMFAFTLLNLGLPHYIIKELSGMSEKRRNKYISELLGFQTIFVGIIFIISIITITYIQVPYLIICILAALTSASAALNTMENHYLRATQRIIQEEIFTFIQNLWMLGIIIYALTLNNLTLGIVFLNRAGFALGTFIMITILLRIKDRIKFKIPTKRVLRPALMFSLPLVPVFLSQYFITAMDRYLLAYFVNTASVGAYTYFYSILSFTLMFATIPLSTLFTYAAKHHKKNIQKSNFFFNAIAKYTLLLLFPALIGILVLQKEIVTLLSGPKYLNDLILLPILLVFPLLAFLSTYYDRACMLKNKTTYITKSYIFAGILNVILNVILIPQYAAIGASFATIITYLVLAIMLYIEGRTLVTWDPGFLRLTRILFASIIMGVIISFFEPQTAITKIITIISGATIYFMMLFILKVFVPDEIKLMRSLIRR